MRELWGRTAEAGTARAVLIGAFLLWELGVRTLGASPLILPAPSAILASFLDAPGLYLRHAGFTLLTTAIGFGLAVALGVALAIGIVSSRLIEHTVYTLLVALNSVPKVALAPLFVIWMGTGAEPRVAIALMLAIFPIVIDTVLGLRSVDPDMLSLAQVYRASPLKVLMRVRFPYALPSIFAGMKVGISFALVGGHRGRVRSRRHGPGPSDPHCPGAVRYDPRLRLASGPWVDGNGAVLSHRSRGASDAALARLAAGASPPAVGTTTCHPESSTNSLTARRLS
jgi:NitT/TauT family transport system permease protein